MRAWRYPSPHRVGWPTMTHGPALGHSAGECIAMPDSDTHSRVDVASRGAVRGARMVVPSSKGKSARYVEHDYENIRGDDGWSIDKLCGTCCTAAAATREPPR